MNLGYTLPGVKKSIPEGRKIHTFREDKNKRWKAGRTVHHHTGRYKTYDCFWINECKSTQLILILWGRCGKYDLKITVDRRRLKDKEIIQLIYNDGFNSVKEFVDWFFPFNKKKGYRPRTMWTGTIIHWTDLKY